MKEWLNVHALVDDELSPEERTRVQVLLQSSQADMAEWSAARSVKTILVEKCLHPECEDVWKRCSKRLDEIDRTKRVEGFVGRYGWSLCGALGCMIIGAAMLNRNSDGGLQTGDVVRASTSLSSPIGAPRSQAFDEKQRWLQEVLDRTVPVPPDRITILQGAEGRMPDGKRVVRIDLQDRTGKMHLIRVDAVEKSGNDAVVREYEKGQVNDVNYIAWNEGGNAYFLVGDRSQDELSRAADTLHAN